MNASEMNAAVALLNEVERQANTPMPLAQRQQRMAELGQRIDTLQRQTLGVDADATGLPPAVLLGVHIVPSEQSARAPRAEQPAAPIERRQRATAAA
jgi:hypothetical protein